jgi:hypothetical protein
MMAHSSAYSYVVHGDDIMPGSECRVSYATAIKAYEGVEVELHPL